MTVENDSPEQPKARTLEDIQNEYQRLATRCGDVSYRVNAMTKDLDLIHKTMRDLNLEAAQLHAKLQAEAAAKASEEAKKAADQSKAEEPNAPQS